MPTPSELLDPVTAELTRLQGEVTYWQGQYTQLKAERDKDAGTGTGIMEPEVQQRIQQATQELQQENTNLRGMLDVAQNELAAVKADLNTLRTKAEASEARQREELNSNGIGDS